MRDLRKYRAKRDPARTPEPFGEDAEARVLPPVPERALPPSAAHAFVVQQHAARALHYDLRLEIDGVLVSWAIPKGPSLDPSQKRLAVQTEDHPLEYADFEGIIPTGNYGAGAMIVWDRGVYRSADGRSPAEGLAAGKLDLALDGHKLRGRFALVRTRRGEGRDWLFFAKGRGPAEASEVVERQPASVFSGLTVEELRTERRLDEALAAAAREAGAPRRTLDAAKLRPMLATPERQPFRRAGWLFELKYDGVRVLAEKKEEEARIFARTGAERTTQYREVATALRHLPVSDAILDGEIVALDELGRSSFERIQRRFGPRDTEAVAAAAREVPVLLYAFDLLAVAGHDLRRLPLVARKALLARLVPRIGFVRFADHVEEDGIALYEAARSHELEGVIAKRADSVYETGRRSRRWLKLKVARSVRLAIVGALPGKGSRKRLGSLLLAGRAGGAWRYVGSVGSGLDEATVDRLEVDLAARTVERAPFDGGPPRWPTGVRFARPELVCEVRYTEVTSAGLLRHPVFVGLCPDAEPEACVAPRSRALPGDAAEASPPRSRAEPAAPRLTRLDKVFWPVEGYTKGDLLAYYERVWPWIAPYLEDRPVVLTRYPDGIEGKSFYQKNAPDFTPAWARRENIDGTDYFVCNELRTLLHVINSGAIPLHVWSARVGSLERPDWLILDLDPKEAPFGAVVEIARHLHRWLEAQGAAHFVKTSGQDGLHVLLPLGGQLTHDEARGLGEAIARTVVAELPEIATVTRPVAARGDKVYVDFLQNGRGKLIAAPFSVRPRPGAPVSMPLPWTSITKRLRPERFTIESAFARLEKQGDPFRGVLGPGIDAVRLLEGLSRRLEGRGRSRRGRA
jgi:bifunctional non-homologous end joining protein LigD